MRWQIPLVAVLAMFMAASCEDHSPTAPTSDTESAAPLSSPAFQVNRTIETRDFDWYGPGAVSWVPCANDGDGENIHWNGILRVLTTKLNTPSGVGTRKNKEVEFMGFDYDDFMGFGQTSLDVWTVNSKKSQWNARKTFKGNTETWHQNYRFALEGEDGEKLNVQGTRQEVYDKEGNLVSFHYNNGSCPDVW